MGTFPLFRVYLMLGIFVYHCCLLKSQHIEPLAYWTFDLPSSNKSGLIDSTNLLYEYPDLTSEIHRITSNGLVGNYVKRIQDDPILLSSKKFGIGSKAVSLEFLARPENFMNVYEIQGAGVHFMFLNNRIKIRVYYQGEQGTGEEDLDIFFDGVDRSSQLYYLDGQWHHIAVTVDFSDGHTQVWVDGASPEGFSANLPLPENASAIHGNALNNFMISSRFHTRNMLGGIDEIAFYNDILSPNIIYQHFLEVNEGRHYTFETFIRSVDVPSLGNEVREIDLKEYAPGHPEPNLSAFEQLKQFPLPRYRKEHTMLPNFDWLVYKHNLFLPRPQSTSNYLNLTLELAQRWNYYLLLPKAQTNNPDSFADTTSLNSKAMALANNHPELPTSLIINWAQVNPSDAGYARETPYAFSQDLPDAYYVQDSSGQILYDGRNNKRISPFSPTDSLKFDGLTMRHYLSHFLSYLHRPLDMINENGEVLYPFSSKADPGILAQDPDIAAHQKKLGLDWYRYDGRFNKYRRDTLYANSFLSLPQLSNTHFTYYYVDGSEFQAKPENGGFSYEENRRIMTPIRGNTYPTPSFYPRVPDNWRIWRGPYNGLKWISLGRKVEIGLGDYLFSPFVSPGWQSDPEKSMRSGQWLGLLKLLGMMGAEFYYAGHFSVEADPDNYIWQAVVPSYAQAIYSRFEPLWRNSKLLYGDDIPNRPDLEFPYVFVTDNIYYKAVVVRKQKDKDIYFIASSIQPNSNWKGSTPIESYVKFNLADQLITIPTRRQGSIFILDLQNEREPIFLQLDSWHEYMHPFYWSESYHFEAEAIAPYGEQEVGTDFSSSVANGDMTQYQSYVILGPQAKKDEMKVDWASRETSDNRYVLSLRARISEHAISDESLISLTLDDTPFSKISIDKRHWAWYRLNCPQKAITLDEGKHLLTLKVLSGLVDVDQLTWEVVVADTLSSPPLPIYAGSGEFDTVGVWMGDCVSFIKTHDLQAPYMKPDNGLHINGEDFLEAPGDAFLVAYNEDRDSANIVHHWVDDQWIEQWNRHWLPIVYDKNVQEGSIQLSFHFPAYGSTVIPQGNDYVLMGKDATWQILPAEYRIVDSSVVFSVDISTCVPLEAFTIGTLNPVLSPLFTREEELQLDLLGVDDILLSGKVLYGNVLLEWETSGKFVPFRFSIERSINGIIFKEIGQVDSEKSDISPFWIYKDNTFDQVPLKVVFYRISAQFREGTSDSVISNIITIQKESSLTPANISSSIGNKDGENTRKAVILSTFPNPAKGEINIKYLAPFGKMKLEIINGLGRVLYSTEVEQSLQMLSLKVRINDWRPGVYYVKLYDLNNSSVYKIIVE